MHYDKLFQAASRNLSKMCFVFSFKIELILAKKRTIRSTSTSNAQKYHNPYRTDNVKLHCPSILKHVLLFGNSAPSCCKFCIYCYLLPLNMTACKLLSLQKRIVAIKRSSYKIARKKVCAKSLSNEMPSMVISTRSFLSLSAMTFTN
ncbi:hypothetical protein I503_00504 [Candida albicans SC5314]|uniref:Uncharacterized protein n=1 Tax=Candida albicans P78048 TaxID=1094989 RepID=A0AB34Q2H5_CANAX|nr:hypothetical protein MG3_00542 [Candida albicans P78048]KHC83289.1 hypothetical protein W5Q_00501 [Candida albicans SC5314]KHC89682.1 hypothetical protein I503_00504 [Candida albicans SC5314]